MYQSVERPWVSYDMASLLFQIHAWSPKLFVVHAGIHMISPCNCCWSYVFEILRNWCLRVLWGHNCLQSPNFMHKLKYTGIAHTDGFHCILLATLCNAKKVSSTKIYNLNNVYCINLHHHLLASKRIQGKRCNLAFCNSYRVTVTTKDSLLLLKRLHQLLQE